MILLYGYYGEHNAGDDAFTTVCANELARRGHGPVGVLSARLPRVRDLPARALLLRRRFRGLSTIVESSRTDRWLRKGARIVVGGGSLFRSAEGLLELEHLLQRSSRTGHLALGVSIGPFRDDAAAEVCSRVLQLFDWVGVRDTPSLERARQLAPLATVELTFDLAPLLASHCDGPTSSGRQKSRELGVALCGPALSETGFHAVRSAVEGWMLSHPGGKVVLLPFNDHPRKGDVAIHQRLAHELGNRGSVELHRYNGDPRAMWNRIARLDGILAMRLHAAVFAYCSERPVLVVPYEEKCTAWAQMIGQESGCIAPARELTGGDLSSLTSRVEPTASLPVHEAVARAALNFRWAEP